jgi:hypothetical protein
MTDNSIANETPNASAPFPDVPAAPATPMTNPTRSPLQSPDPKIRRAWQAALSNIRKKNRAGRPPLA